MSIRSNDAHRSAGSKSIWDRFLRVLEQIARRKACTSIAGVLIAGGCTLLAGGSVWLPMIVKAIEQLGYRVPDPIKQATSASLFSQCVGLLMIASGPIAWYFCSRKPKPRFVITVTERCQYLYGTLRDGVLTGPNTERVPGADFYFEIQGQMFANHADVEIISMQFDIYIPNFGILNSLIILRIRDKELDIISGTRFLDPFLVEDRQSVGFYCLQRAKPMSTHAPIDCAEATLRGYVRYRIKDIAQEYVDLFRWDRSSTDKLTPNRVMTERIVERGYEWRELETG